jgi:hypothetical protein
MRYMWMIRLRANVVEVVNVMSRPRNLRRSGRGGRQADITQAGHCNSAICPPAPEADVAVSRARHGSKRRCDVCYWT